MIASTNQSKHTELLHSFYLSGRLNDEEIFSYLSTYQANTEKAEGFIKVDNKTLALEVLRKHFKDNGDEYKMEYYPETKSHGQKYGFIQDSDHFLGGFYLGKFELCFSDFLMKLHEAGVVIEDFLIVKDEDYF